MERIVYTLALGNRKLAEGALGLGRSLKLIGDTTRRVVVTDQLGPTWSECFDEVIEPAEGVDARSILERNGIDQLLYVAPNCLAFRRLAPIFEYFHEQGERVASLEDRHFVPESEFFGQA